MSGRNLRLALGIFFAVMAIGLFGREWFWPGISQKFKATNLTIGAWFALVLSGMNLSRWYLAWSDPRSRPRAVNPLSVRRPAEEEAYVPNPELDFLKVPDADRTPKPGET